MTFHCLACGAAHEISVAPASGHPAIKGDVPRPEESAAKDPASYGLRTRLRAILAAHRPNYKTMTWISQAVVAAGGRSVSYVCVLNALAELQREGIAEKDAIGRWRLKE